MFFVTISEDFHGNKEGFVSLDYLDIKKHLKAALDNWDAEYTDDQLDLIIEKGRGFVNENSKADVEISITEIEPGERIDL